MERARMRFAVNGNVVSDERTARIALQVQRCPWGENAAYHGGTGNGCTAGIVEVPQHVARISIDLAHASLPSASGVQDDLIGHRSGCPRAIHVDDQSARPIRRNVVNANRIAIARDVGQRQIDVSATRPLRVSNPLVVHVREVTGGPLARGGSKGVRKRRYLILHIIQIDERSRAGVKILPNGFRPLDLRCRGLPVSIVDDVVAVLVHREQAEGIGVAAEHDRLIVVAIRGETRVRTLIVLDIGKR